MCCHRNRSAQEWFSGREQIDGPTSDFKNPLAARHSRRSALYEFSRRNVHMAEVEEAACLPRRRQNRREHRPEQLSDGPAAFSSHATVFIPQPRSDVRAHHCADPYRWSDLSRCIGPFLRCDGEEQDHIHSHFWSARLVPCGSRAVDSQRARMGRTAAHRANHRAEPAHVACDATSRP